MPVDIAQAINQNTAKTFTPQADPSKPWWVPVETQTGFTPQYSLNWDLAKAVDLNSLGSPLGQSMISGPANDPGWDAYTAARKAALAGSQPNTVPKVPTENMPAIPKGITMGASGTSPASNYSMDVWDYLKNFQMPNTFEAPNTDAPKVGWGI